jgi:pyruvate decarboxylase
VLTQLGAYAEQAGMIHIVGMTSRPCKLASNPPSLVLSLNGVNIFAVQKNRVMVHHTLEPNMDHAVYIPMAEPIRKTYAYLMDDKTMAEEIDRVIIECIRSRLPVFIYVPTDVVSVQLDASRLDTPLDYTIKNPDSLVEDEIVGKVLELIKGAEKPVILGDVLAIRHGGRALTRELVELSKLQNFSTPLSKGIFDEKSPTYGGLYNGTSSLHFSNV